MGNRLLVIKFNKQKFWCTLLVLLIAMWAGANTSNPDLHNYVYHYYRTASAAELSVAYYFIKNICLRIGFSFELFRLLLYFCGAVIIAIANAKLTDGNPITFVFYAICFMMIDSTQTNNFIGFAILYLGVSYLITEDSRLKYIICVLIASGFHIIFLFYIPFVFLYRRTDKKQLLKVYLLVLAIVVLLSTVAGVSGLAGIIQRIITLAGLENYQSYLEARTRFGHLYPMMTHLTCCCFGYCFYTRSQSLGMQSEKIHRVIFLLLLYGIFAFPLFRFQLTLGRLSRNLQLLTFVSGIRYSDELKNKNAKRNVIIALFVLAFFLSHFIYRNYTDNIVKPFFENNWIFTGR